MSAKLSITAQSCQLTCHVPLLQSGIHGWGLIAKERMKQDSMIIEYRGESLRRAMADAREKIYRLKDMDCYLFNINDDVVIDATVKGTIGRFTVSQISRSAPTSNSPCGATEGENPKVDFACVDRLHVQRFNQADFMQLPDCLRYKEVANKALQEPMTE